jgi:glycyl-tRNA synthetase
MSKEEELHTVFTEEKIKSPDNNDLSYPFKFNLMFETQIGPTGGVKGYLRPETAQGHFVNFKRLLEFNGSKVPFASASIGLGFRNEISPRSGLLRVREFTMAEIEHYVDPLNKTHKKFDSIKHMKLPLWTAVNQMAYRGVVNEITLEEAVNEKLINNETLAYFLARTYLFLTTIGIRKEGVRFRQHTEKEMAHYASDCWDAEVETSYGWIEVAGHADRACYDLENHTLESKVELVASRQLKTPKIKQTVRVSMNKANIYKTFKEKNKDIVEFLDKLSEKDKEDLLAEFTENEFITANIHNEVIKLSKDIVTFEKKEETIFEEKFIPGVIEPSFGIGRIVYCVMEHCFGVRQNDEKRTVFNFPPVVAPYKVSIIPLIHDKEMLAYVEPISMYYINLRENSCTKWYQLQN